MKSFIHRGHTQLTGKAEKNSIEPTYTETDHVKSEDKFFEAIGVEMAKKCERENFSLD